MRAQLLRALVPLRFGSAGFEGAQALKTAGNSNHLLAGLFSNDEQSEKPSVASAYKPFAMSQMLSRSLTTSSMSGVPAPGSNGHEQVSDKQMETFAVKALAAAVQRNPSIMMASAKSAQQKVGMAFSTAAAGGDELEEIHDMRLQNHPFHVLPYSWWPMLAGCSVFNTILGTVMWWHHYPGGEYVLATGLTNVTLTATNWWRDMCIESQMGMHNDIVRDNMMTGMYWFILSEAMLFFGLLWSCIHVGMMPTVGVHMQWPPVGIAPIEWDKRALVMSAVLAASYFSANLAMYSKPMLWLTVFMGALFLVTQYVEYASAPFTITDSAYGSTFYMTTGFHGMHVFFGSIYLAVCALMKPTTYGPSIGLRNAILYWHFVDIVWIGVYGIIYVGGY
jgi:cytochrome c oxidase subunit 3